jgi:hypothetical protein
MSGVSFEQRTYLRPDGEKFVQVSGFFDEERRAKVTFYALGIRP